MHKNIIMASVKNLKKDINYTLGDLYDICVLNSNLNPNIDSKKTDELIEELFTIHDELIEKINVKDVDNKKAHFKSINVELETRATAFIDKLNAL